MSHRSLKLSNQDYSESDETTTVQYSDEDATTEPPEDYYDGGDEDNHGYDMADASVEYESKEAVDEDEDEDDFDYNNADYDNSGMHLRKDFSRWGQSTYFRYTLAHYR